MTLYLQQILGLSAIEAGLVYIPGTVIMFLVSGATATLGTRVHPGTLISVPGARRGRHGPDAARR